MNGKHWGELVREFEKAFKPLMTHERPRWQAGRQPFEGVDFQGERVNASELNGLPSSIWKYEDDQPVGKLEYSRRRWSELAHFTRSKNDAQTYGISTCLEIFEENLDDFSDV